MSEQPVLRTDRLILRPFTFDDALPVQLLAGAPEGLPYWNRGYCTEAVRAMLQLGFASLGLHRIQARHLISL